MPFDGIPDLSRQLLTPELLRPGRFPRASSLYELDTAHPLARGLVGWWPLNDGAGSLARDLSGRGNSGTLVNGPKWTPGARGCALDFDGTAEYVNIGTAFAGLGARTIAAWVYLDALNADGAIVSNYLPPYSNGQTLLWFDAVNGISTSTDVFSYAVLTSGDTSNWLWLESDQITSVGWYHVVVSHDLGNTPTMYVDGDVSSNILANGTLSHALNSNPLNIGRSPAGLHYLNGKICDARIYNRSLTRAECLAIFRGAMPLRPRARLFFFPAASGGGETGALTFAGSAGASIGATVAASSSLSFGAQAGDADLSLAAANASLASGVDADEMLSALAQAAGAVAAGVDAAETITAAVLAQAAGAVVAGADAGETLAALVQAAGAVVAGAAAGDSWVSATDGAEVASLAARTDAGASYLAAAQTYGSLVGAASASSSLTALASALGDFASPASAGAAFAALVSAPQGVLTVASSSGATVSGLAVASVTLIAAALSDATFTGLSSAQGRVALRGSIALLAALRGLPSLRPN